MDVTFACHREHEWKQPLIAISHNSYEEPAPTPCPTCGGHASEEMDGDFPDTGSTSWVTLCLYSLVECDAREAIRTGQRAAFFRNT